MRCTRRTCGSAGLLTVTLGAVLYGCAFFVPAVGAAAGITVEIIKPTTEPRYTFDTGEEYEFEAVAFVEGQELPGGEVSWQWSFGDGTDHVLANPTTHTFARTGNWTVTVTATYGALSGEATLNAAAAAGGLLDAVEFLVVPDTGGQVCDSVEVMWRIPFDELNEHLAIVGPVSIYRNNDGQWDEQYTYGRWQQMEDDEWYYVVSTWWDSCSDSNTEAVDWRVDYILWVNEPPPPDEEGPYYATVTDTKNDSWTPFNTVLTGDDECLIKHCVGDTTHTVSFNIAHLQDAEAGIDPKYHVVLTIYDLQGNQVDQVTKDDVAVGGGSIDWEPEFGEGGEPPEEPVDHNEIYAYRITADHGMCGDSWPKPLGGSVTAAYITTVTSTNSFKAIVKYHLSRELKEGEITAWRHDPDGWEEAGGVGLGHLEPGDWWTDEFVVTGDPNGKYSYILTGWETPEDGEGNRGGDPQPGVPDGVDPPPDQKLVHLESVHFINREPDFTDLDGDWGMGGNAYPGPTWRDGRQEGENPNPSVFVRGTRIRVGLVLPMAAGLQYDVCGDGGVDYLRFHLTGMAADPPQYTSSQTDADAVLPDTIQAQQRSITWTIHIANPDVTITVDTGSYPIYIIYDHPKLHAVPGMRTKHRLDWVVDAASGASTPLGIADKIFAASPAGFSHTPWPLNDMWTLMAGAGSCDQLAELMTLAVGLLGVESVRGYVYPTADTNWNCYSTSSNANEPRDPPCPAHGQETLWFRDNAQVLNKYEAVCAVTGNTLTKYYALTLTSNPEPIEIMRLLVNRGCKQVWTYLDNGQRLECDNPNPVPLPN